MPRPRARSSRIQGEYNRSRDRLARELRGGLIRNDRIFRTVHKKIRRQAAKDIALRNAASMTGKPVPPGTLRSIDAFTQMKLAGANLRAQLRLVHRAERPSRGMRKHIRNQKAAQRRPN